MASASRTATSCTREGTTVGTAVAVLIAEAAVALESTFEALPSGNPRLVKLGRNIALLRSLLAFAGALAARLAACGGKLALVRVSIGVIPFEPSVVGTLCR